MHSQNHIKFDTNIVYAGLQTAYSTMRFNVLYDTECYVIGPAHC